MGSSITTVVSALNNEVTREQKWKKPSDAIKVKAVMQKPFTVASRPAGLEEEKLPSSVGM